MLIGHYPTEADLSGAVIDVLRMLYLRWNRFAQYVVEADITPEDYAFLMELNLDEGHTRTSNARFQRIFHEAHEHGMTFELLEELTHFLPQLTSLDPEVEQEGIDFDHHRVPLQALHILMLRGKYWERRMPEININAFGIDPVRALIPNDETYNARFEQEVHLLDTDIDPLSTRANYGIIAPDALAYAGFPHGSVADFLSGFRRWAVDNYDTGYDEELEEHRFYHGY